MKILLLYPKFAEAMWAYKHALRYIGKKASSPPLGLLTVAAMLPESWEKSLIDLNIRPLIRSDLEGVDLVFISAMLAQMGSTERILEKCRDLGIPTVGGGPLFSVSGDNHLALEPDHIISGEAEGSLLAFLADLEAGKPNRRYQAEGFPDVRISPVPLWDLVEDFSFYTMMTIQFTRGCPYDCEFCDVVILNGRVPRMKSISQIISELDALYKVGWRGHLFVCDDNLIGNPKICRESLLPAITHWMKSHSYPFVLTAAVSVNLADHPDIMKMMLEAGFDRVTIGIESPSPDSLQETNKLQNLGHDLLEAISKIQVAGLEVQAGFILGFDKDTPEIFSEQVDFIQASGIATAMVSILFAFPGTRLHSRLEREKRLLPVSLDQHAYGVVNFIPKMGVDQLRRGHLEVLERIYSPESYYQRLKVFLERHNHLPQRRPVRIEELRLLPRILWDIGIVDSGRRYFWRMILFCIRKKVVALPMIIRLLVTGYHFRKDIKTYRLAISS